MTGFIITVGIIMEKELVRDSHPVASLADGWQTRFFIGVFCLSPSI